MDDTFLESLIAGQLIVICYCLNDSVILFCDFGFQGVHCALCPPANIRFNFIHEFSKTKHPLQTNLCASLF